MLTGKLAKVWNSPVLTTWASLLAQSLSLVVVIPVIITRLTVEDVALYYVLVTLITFQAVLNVGFTPTFTRLVGFAMAGLPPERMADLNSLPSSLEKKDLEDDAVQKSLGRVVSTIRVVHKWIAFLALVPFAILAAFFAAEPIANSSSLADGWIALFIVVLVTLFKVFGSQFESVLRGSGQIALVSRWQAVSNFASILTILLVLYLSPSVVSVIVAHQSWQVFNVLRNWILCRRWLKRYSIDASQKFDRVVFDVSWPRAWRSGLGVFANNGVIQLLALDYAKNTDSETAATYLLAVRIVTAIDQFSMAPFYTKLPIMNRVRASGDLKGHSDLAQSGMLITNCIFVLGILTVAVLGNRLLLLIDASVMLPSATIWVGIASVFWLNRYSAMHIQNYSVTNHIVWHWLNGISGLIALLVYFLMSEASLGLYTIPFAMLCGGLFNASLSLYFSQKVIFGSLLSFEARATGPSLLLFLLIAPIVVLLQ
ncbi:MAG: hypothetical protein ACPGN3_00950 [Opitutales bacterium]